MLLRKLPKGGINVIEDKVYFKDPRKGFVPLTQELYNDITNNVVKIWGKLVFRIYSRVFWKKQLFVHNYISRLGTTILLYEQNIFSRTKDPIPFSKNSGVVYRIPCGGCPSYYVGETGQLPEKRIYQHIGTMKTRKTIILLWHYTQKLLIKISNSKMLLFLPACVLVIKVTCLCVINFWSLKKIKLIILVCLTSTQFWKIFWNICR